jgi:ectoine hydroxylase-related dioxygenase (phytanoyl-CoA dioxygenase family)
MDKSHVEQLREEGYAIVRGFVPPGEIARIERAVDAVYDEGMSHPKTFRHGNLMFEIVNDPQAGEKLVIQSYWAYWVNKLLEEERRHPRVLEALEPLIGRSFKQVTNQIHWKHPRGKYTFYRYHQDVRFRENKAAFGDFDASWVTTGLAVNAQDAANGALQVFPGSHKRGYLGLSEGGTIMAGETPEQHLIEAGLDPADMVQCVLEPGDLVLWTLYTVHGSPPNTSDRIRKFIINSYVAAAASPDRGEWVFRDGVSTPLGDEPEICKFERLREEPGPVYIEDSWTDERKQA